MDDGSRVNLPHGVALSWGLVRPPQRGPKRELSLDQIVAVAIEIADRDGLAALSMGQIAAALGFTTMSLYRYVSSKDDLVLLMQDAIAGRLVQTEAACADWRDCMRSFVRAMVPMYRDHGWLAEVPVTGAPITPNSLRIVDWALRTMRGLPLADHEKMSVVLLISAYARSYGILQRELEQAWRTGAGSEPSRGSEVAEALKQLVTAERFPDLHPIVISGGYVGGEEPASAVGEDFDFGLERIIDGIAHYLATKRPAALD